MHLISFDASPRQLSKLRNGHKVRIKKGTGFNLIVHPENYRLVSRAFTKNKGVELKLSPEEVNTNEELTEDEHNQLGSEADENLFQHLPFAEGGSIFKRRGVKGGKLSLKKIGKDIQKAFKSPIARKIGHELKPLGRVLKSTAKDLLHQKLDELHSSGQQQYGSNQAVSGIMGSLADIGHKQISGLGLGTGLGAGMNAHDALKLASLANAKAHHEMAKIHNMTVHGQLSQPPIKRYYDDAFAPKSRGTGLHNHHNMVRGRGSMLSQDDILPPALQSQPYGANFHMQFMLPPQYHKFNSGGEMEGRGLYI